MSNTKIYRSGHLFWLVWLGQVPQNKPMFNVWMWSLVCQCSCLSVWRAWCPLHVAEALGTALGTERIVQAVLAGLHLFFCISHWCVFWLCQHSCRMSSVCLTSAERPMPRKTNKEQREAWKARWSSGNWLSWTELQGSRLSELNQETLSLKALVLYQAW